MIRKMRNANQEISNIVFVWFCERYAFKFLNARKNFENHNETSILNRHLNALNPGRVFTIPPPLNVRGERRYTPGIICSLSLRHLAAHV